MTQQCDSRYRGRRCQLRPGHGGEHVDRVNGVRPDRRGTTSLWWMWRDEDAEEVQA